MEVPKTVTMQVIYPDGDPDGVVTIANRPQTGHAIAFPRDSWKVVSRNKDHKKRFFEKRGVYVLWRPRGKDGKNPMAYVGQSDKDRIGDRIRGHLRKDKWDWTHVVAYTANHLYAPQIEARLYKEAKDARVCDLKNAQEPRLLNQGDADAHETNLHIYNLTRFFLPLVGCDYFRPRVGVATRRKPQKTPRMVKTASVAVATSTNADFSLDSRKVKAWGRKTDNGFLVYKGSQAKPESGHFRNPGMERYANIRDDLEKKKILMPDGDVYRFTDDYLFVSKRGATGAMHVAATVILGANAVSGNWQPQNSAPGKTQK